MSFRLGLEALVDDPDALQTLRKSSVGLVAHPASVSSRCEHSIDLLINKGANITRAFGPQHGMRGDKQDNMIESDDYHDQVHGIDVFSLYGRLRFPSEEMLHGLDIILFDLQDIGCRIYTYITTLFYFIQACEKQGLELWILDRPNPAGRPIDGTFLCEGNESFVGCAPLPTRHGLTVGELSLWFVKWLKSDVAIKILKMVDYSPEQKPGLGWPTSSLPWVNPSPNAASLNMARCFSGTVLLEGTTLSEGRGTSRPLEVIGAPDLPVLDMISLIREEAEHWLRGAALRPCFFSPTSNKHQNKLCAGLQIHTDVETYDHHGFKPYRLVSGLLKSYKKLMPDADIWRYHEYEYEKDRIPIDVIDGSDQLRKWVDNSNDTFSDLAKTLDEHEKAWAEERKEFLLYK